MAEEHLAYLRPSRQLLEFYRKKIGEYDHEHEQMTGKLEEFKQAFEQEHKTEWEVRQREAEIAELQKALSDMQVFLFKEREQVLRLHGENDRFKGKDLENKRTIQQLLALGGQELSEGEVSYFFRAPPDAPIVPDRTGFKNIHMNGIISQSSAAQRKPTANRPNLQVMDTPDEVTLTLQIEALQSQLDDQIRWAKEHTEALLEDKRIKAEEYETRRQRDLDKIKTTTQKLHKTQDLLYASTQDILRLRKECKDRETRWMLERDKLLLELDKVKARLNAGRPELGEEQPAMLNTTNNAFTSTTARYKHELKRLRGELENSQRMSDMYREQVISLEDEIAKIKETDDLKNDTYQNKTTNMAKRYEILKARYADLEKRRNLEVEGFKNDVKMLRKQLKAMERQLYKATIVSGDMSILGSHQPSDLDLMILNNVRKTASRSVRINNELRGLKNKVYSLQHDIKHL